MQIKIKQTDVKIHYFKSQFVLQRNRFHDENIFIMCRQGTAS